MATELAAGYVSLTVKMAKGGMAEVTKEITKTAKESGKDAGQVYSDEFNKKVGTEVGKKLPDTVTKATKSGGGLKKAAQDAAGEFGKGILEGITQELGRGGGGGGGGLGDIIVGSATKGIKEAIGKNEAATIFTEGLIDGIKQGLGSGAIDDAVKGVTESLNKIGDNVGEQFRPVIEFAQDAAEKVDAVGTAAANVKTSFDAFKTGDIGGGLTAAVDALRGLETIGLPPDVADGVQTLSDKLGTVTGQADGLKGQFEEINTLVGTVMPGQAAKGAALIEAAYVPVMAFLAAPHIQDWVNETVPGASWINKIPTLESQLIDISRILQGEPAQTPYIKALVESLNGTNGALAKAQALLDAAKEKAVAADAEFRKVVGTVTAMPDKKTMVVDALTDDAEAKLEDFGFKVEHMPDGKVKLIPLTAEATAMMDRWRQDESAKPVKPGVQPDITQANVLMQNFVDQWSTAIIRPEIATPLAPPVPPSGPRNPLEVFQPPRPGRAGGGSIHGAGGPKSDSIPIWASNGEHVLSAADVNKMGGQKGVYAFRSMLGGFQSGGAIDAGIAYAASISGLPYVYGGVGPGGFDCSGAQSALYAVFTGKSPGTRYFTTESNFEGLGFKRGFMPGAYNIGISRGGGGKLSHMGATLPNGVTFEAGGANRGVMYGDGARGANSFPLQFYLPLGGGDPSGGAAGGRAPAAGGGGGGGGGGGAGGGAGGGGGAPSNPFASLQDVAAKRGQLGADQKALDQQQADAVKAILPDFGQLADIGAGGIKETLLPPGFSDPTQWPNVKSVGALLKWIGAISGNPQAKSILGGIGGAITGSGSQLYEGIMGAIPQPFGNLPEQTPPAAGDFAAAPPVDAGAGTGPPPGPAPPPGGGGGGPNVNMYGDVKDYSGQSAFAQATKTVDFVSKTAMPRNLVSSG